MHPNNTLLLYCDGLVEPCNPGGWGCWAWLAIGPNGKRLRDARGCVGRSPDVTNNKLEYQAVIEALTYTVAKAPMLGERGIRVLVRSDSQLVIKQVLGEWGCNTPHLVPLRDKVQGLADTLNVVGVPVAFEWIPREENAEADALTRQAYQEARRAERRQPVEDLL
jgi:ribonuclease HI